MKRASFLISLGLVLVICTTAFAAWNDGTYEAWSDAGARSTQYAKVFIKDGKIAAVIVREFTDRLVEKDWTNYSYPPFGEAARAIGAEFVKTQSADIDVISGATGSSQGWIQAVERALVKASPQKPGNKYFDGTFLGRSDVASRGYYEVVWVTIKDDQITDIKIQRVLEDLSILDPADYNYPLEAAREAYVEQAIAGNTSSVDTISGATGLTGMLNIAVQDALDRAVIQ